MPETFFVDRVDAFKDDDWRSLGGVQHVRALVSGEVISWDLSVLARNQFCNLFKCQVKVKGFRMVEVVVCCVFVLFVAEWSLRIDLR